MMQLMGGRCGIAGSDTTIDQAMAAFGKLECAIAQDRVFALIGLLASWESRAGLDMVDYSASPAELIVRVYNSLTLHYHLEFMQTALWQLRVLPTDLWVPFSDNDDYINLQDLTFQAHGQGPSWWPACGLWIQYPGSNIYRQIVDDHPANRNTLYCVVADAHQWPMADDRLFAFQSDLSNYILLRRDGSGQGSRRYQFIGLVYRGIRALRKRPEAARIHLKLMKLIIEHGRFKPGIADGYHKAPQWECKVSLVAYLAVLSKLCDIGYFNGDGSIHVNVPISEEGEDLYWIKNADKFYCLLRDFVKQISKPASPGSQSSGSPAIAARLQSRDATAVVIDPANGAAAA